MKFLMPVMLTVMISTLLVNGSQAQSVAEVSARVSEALRTTETYYYEFEHYATDALKDYFPMTSGMVYLSFHRDPADGPFEAARLVVQSESAPVDLRIQGNTIQLRDEGQKRIVEGKLYRTGPEMFNEQFLAPAYLLADIENAAEKHGEILGFDDCNDLPCVKLKVISEGDLQLTFWIDLEQYFIQKIEATTPVYPGGAIVMQFGDVQDRDYDAQRFDTTIPDGFTTQLYSGAYPTPGQPLTSWNAQTLSGETLTSEELKGNIVILDFWATWCRPCIQSLPHLNALHAKYSKQGLVIVGVNALDNRDPAEFVKTHKLSYRNVKGDSVASLYGISSLPFVMLIDRQGNLIDFYNGYFGEQSDARLESAVKNCTRHERRYQGIEDLTG